MKKILVHAAAGGVGQFLCQLASHLGIEVIGTVGSDAKISQAKSNGCSHVINYTNKNFVDEVARITNNRGVGVVYDSVGKTTISKSIDCLWQMGICVSYGECSGNLEKIDPNQLLFNSLYFTKITLALYKANRIELSLASSEIFKLLSKSILKPKITTYNFEEVQKAHKDLESRKSMGSLILKL